MKTIIELKNLTKTFDDDKGHHLKAVENINLSINDGEFFTILGPSGCGKSTLLRLMSSLEKSFKGEVNFLTPMHMDDIAFVFQQFALYPWLTVSENIELGLINSKLSQKDKKHLLKVEIERFGLYKFAHSYPRELSGGMRQRVGIARAWISKPKIIFMDEPFSELDSFTAAELRLEVLKNWQAEHTTIIMVTHLVSEAIELADRIAILTENPGKIERIITNNLPRPRNTRSLDFFKLEDNINRIIKPDLKKIK